ncbi:hypothetical protein H4R20_003404 [Coemansia guatemalensis]|uniref:Uncharacterized protein n=1 Tax=Coemansia guatemalensis TaxID=2761395 RepID=A0A9W8HVP5_9FUNG|nr:hypothetical protein H4R20_003404 [Coemansia guatemalensis]
MAAPGTAMSSSSAMSNTKDGQQHTLRVYELETTVTQLREANAQTQRTTERLERDHQRTLDELESLHGAHSRLEARLFEGEAELATANASLERLQRANTALTASLERKDAALDRERDAWQRKEAELRDELAAAKRRAVIGRRQTVSTTTHARTGSASFAHGVPASNASDTADAMQNQIRLLTHRLRDADARAQEATEQAARFQADAEHAAAALDSSQRRTEKLELAAQQLGELNESLREDNESYQMLLQMSTIKGGLSFANHPRASLDSRASSGPHPASPAPAEAREPPADAGALDLASELGQVLSPLSSNSSIDDATQTRIAALEEQATLLREDLRKTKYERRHLSEENKALSLYVNKILARILSSADGLEAVLSHDFDSVAPAKKTATPSSSFALPAARPATAKHVRHSSARLIRNPPQPRSQPPKQQPPPPPPPPPASLALFSEPGTGDGITSVFIPPSSPATLRTNKQLPASPQSPPPFSRRVRSATVSAGAMPAHTREDEASGAGSATVGPAAGGSWWKRMSMRLGTGWNAPDTAQQPES